MLTVESVREVLDYDPETGEFRWKVSRRGSGGVGSVAGTIAVDSWGKRYRVLRVCGKSWRAHRVAWLLVTGEMPTRQIDHIDGDGTNNAFSNLRQVSNLENARNQRKHKNNTSGVPGVHWHSRDKCWNAKIRVEGKTIHLGNFQTVEEAAAVRKSAELKYGFHPNHGSDRPL